jgi:hypothetical protein
MSVSSQQYQFYSEWADGPPSPVTSPATYQRRALLIWPGLDRERLRRTHGDPWKIARLVAPRTSLSTESILTLLMGIGIAAGASEAAAPETGTPRMHPTTP